MVRLFSKPKYRILVKDGDQWIELDTIDEKPTIAKIRNMYPDIEDYDAVRVVDDKGKTVYSYKFRRKKRNSSDVDDPVQVVKKFRELKRALAEVLDSGTDPLEGIAYSLSIIETVLKIMEKYPGLRAIVCPNSTGGGDIKEIFDFINGLRGLIPQQPIQPQSTQPPIQHGNMNLPQPSPEALEEAKKIVLEGVEEASNMVVAPCEALGKCLGEGRNSDDSGGSG